MGKQSEAAAASVGGYSMGKQSEAGADVTPLKRQKTAKTSGSAPTLKVRNQCRPGRG